MNEGPHDQDAPVAADTLLQSIEQSLNGLLSRTAGEARMYKRVEELELPV